MIFSASADLGAGYLTVSENFPMEIRAGAPAVSSRSPDLRGDRTGLLRLLIRNDNECASLAIGCLVSGGIMLTGGLAEMAFGINAEVTSLEAVTEPLTRVDA